MDRGKGVLSHVILNVTIAICCDRSFNLLGSSLVGCQASLGEGNPNQSVTLLPCLARGERDEETLEA